MDAVNINERPFIKAAGLALFGQLICIILQTIVAVTMGTAPQSAAEYFNELSRGVVPVLMRDDMFNVLLIFLYLFSFYGLFILLKRKHPLMTFFAFAGSVMTIVFCIVSHPGFSMFHLYKSSLVNPEMKETYLAAGEALLAGNMWHNTGGFFSGVLLQGGGILMSIAMISDKRFRRLTIISGLVSNGLDLINHLIHYSHPQIAEKFLWSAGPFYIIWMVSLALDLLKIASTKTEVAK